jgi:hypothetical protein
MIALYFSGDCEAIEQIYHMPLKRHNAKIINLSQNCSVLNKLTLSKSKKE